MSSEHDVPDLVVATSLTASHLPRARVLAASLKRRHPELRHVVLLIEDPGDTPHPEAEPFEVLLPGDLEDDLRTLAFRYLPRVAAAACKPRLMRALLARGHRHVLYLDADIFVAGDLTPLLDAVREASIALTPHLLEPATGPDARARELQLVRAGVINAGVLGVSAGEEAGRFLEWWSARVVEHCVADLDNGLHLDQRWVDLVPGMFDGVRILRDPGVNVAYWNLDQRPLHISGDRVTAGGHPCRLLHASGYDVRHPERLSVYEPGLPLEGDVRRLAECYRRALLDAGEVEALSVPWSFSCWSDGTPIEPTAREAHRLLGADAARFGDPFATGAGSFRGWLAAQSTT